MFIPFSIQDDIPSGSLKFHYGPVDMVHDHGGYTTVKISSDTMTTTFYDYKGIPYVVELIMRKCSLLYHIIYRCYTIHLLS